MKITIIGMGQMGASLGLALAPYRKQIRRVGLDKLLPVSGKARSLGALDRVAVNLSSAVQKADIVFLALPLSSLSETLEIIADSLSSDALLIETGTAKEQALQWVDRFCAPGQALAGVLPILPAAAGALTSRPRRDLFAGGLWLVAETPRLTESAWRKTRALAALLGARAQKMPPASIDHMSVFYDALPRLLSVALLQATLEQPGWFDARKVAARPYYALVDGLAHPDDDQILLSSLFAHPDWMLRDIDALLAELQTLRGMLQASHSAALSDWLKAARQTRAEAVAQSHSPDLTPEEALKILIGSA